MALILLLINLQPETTLPLQSLAYKSASQTLTATVPSTPLRITYVDRAKKRNSIEGKLPFRIAKVSQFHDSLKHNSKLSAVADTKPISYGFLTERCTLLRTFESTRAPRTAELGRRTRASDAVR